MAAPSQPLPWALLIGDVCSLHWGNLHGMLLSQLPADRVHFGKSGASFQNTQV